MRRTRSVSGSQVEAGAYGQGVGSLPPEGAGCSGSPSCLGEGLLDLMPSAIENVQIPTAGFLNEGSIN